MKYLRRDVLKRKVKKHLRGLGFIFENGNIIPPECKSKEQIRKFHEVHRFERLKHENEFIQERGRELIEHFANGAEIDPSRIDPYLEVVQPNSINSDLFRFATLIWSVPVSHGYGRRMRFLVKDRQNGKLIGLIGLGDPVFNLSARDKIIGWSSKDREERLCNVMDAYVLGAVPPYSKLLGGKLVAALVSSKEINDYFHHKYSNVRSEIRERITSPRLVAVTTTSSLGRSSIYNRLSINGSLLFQPVGYTKGWGHFHFPQSLFALMVRYLKQARHKYAKGYKFGNGPNWRIRVIRETIRRLAIDQGALNHGVQREVYIVPLARNWNTYLNGKSKRAMFELKTVQEISEFCLMRWIIPRSARDGSFQSIHRDDILAALLKECTSVTS